MTTESRIDGLRALVRDIPDFPKPGILFRDVTPLLADPDAFNLCLDILEERHSGADLDVIVGIESRGFIFGAALAARMGKSFVPVRKPGKLPSKTIRVEYDLEYGTDALEMHVDALSTGTRVLVVDDLLATGGTASAALDLVRLLGAVPVAATFVIALDFLRGDERLAPVPTSAILRY